MLSISSARWAVAALCGFAMAMAALPAAFAQSAPTAASLPGGASSLTETHGDWTVSCQLQGEKDQAVRLCALSQQQANAQGQRILAIELRPSDAGASGAIILPFGLAVTRGATLKIDDGTAGESLPFSTCLPAGCIVPVTLDAARIAALSQGKTLTVTATAASGGETNLTISLTGFTGALDRTKDLAK